MITIVNSNAIAWRSGSNFTSLTGSQKYISSGLDISSPATKNLKVVSYYIFHKHEYDHEHGKE